MSKKTLTARVREALIETEDSLSHVADETLVLASQVELAEDTVTHLDRFRTRYSHVIYRNEHTRDRHTVVVHYSADAGRKWTYTRTDEVKSRKAVVEYIADQMRPFKPFAG